MKPAKHEKHRRKPDSRPGGLANSHMHFQPTPPNQEGTDLTTSEAKYCFSAISLGSLVGQRRLQQQKQTRRNKHKLHRMSAGPSLLPFFVTRKRGSTGSTCHAATWEPESLLTVKAGQGPDMLCICFSYSPSDGSTRGELLQNTNKA